MIEKIVIISLLVLAIHYSMQEGEIFGKLGDWLYYNLPDKIHKPIFACNVCMCPWYGSLIYWIIPWVHIWWVGIVVVLSAMGTNIVLNRFTKDEETIISNGANESITISDER